MTQPPELPLDIRNIDGVPLAGERLPCGCWIATRETDGVKAFLMEPCSLDCEYLRYAVEASRDQGKPVRGQIIRDRRP